MTLTSPLRSFASGDFRIGYFWDKLHSNEPVSAEAQPDTCTAQLVISDSEAYIAYSETRSPRGPNGEPRIARLIHTADGGKTWKVITWRRHVLSRIRHPGFPNWPPEAIIAVEAKDREVAIIHRDEWVPFEPGGESLWQSTLVRGAWWTKRLRSMNYENADAAMPISHVPISLPASILPPNDATW